MSSGVQASVIAVRRFVPGRATVVMVAAAAALLVAGCGDKKDKDKPASQSAAKVNKEEITVHQINFVLSQQRGLPPEQAASAGRRVLERLIDQELALQKAQDQKIDRDPRVVQQLEAARREIIARAYVEKVGAGASKPTPVEIKAYYDAHPALFKERKLYSLQELAIEAKPEQIAVLRDKLATAKDLQAFVDFLKANEYKFAGNQAVRAAEQLPLATLDRFAAMKDGERSFNQTPKGAQVVILAGTRSQPVDEQRAASAIELFLLNERKRKIVDDDLKALRAAAKVEYVGDYANAGKEAPPPVVDAATPLSATAAAASEPLVMATPQMEVEPINSSPASAPSAKAIEKGIKGFK
jgi:EpsD family peptidyl-prolyl cis-trans isomerase